MPRKPTLTKTGKKRGRGEAKTSKHAMIANNRRVEYVRLRVEHGLTLREIGARLGVTQSAVHQGLCAELAKVKHGAAELQNLELARLDMVVKKHWNKVTKPSSARVILQAIALRARIGGVISGETTNIEINQATFFNLVQNPQVQAAAARIIDDLRASAANGNGNGVVVGPGALGHS